MYWPWKYRHTSGGETVHLIHIMFSVLPFPPLPIPWNVASLTCITVELHCKTQWDVLSFTCIFSRCCLQLAAVFQAGIIFQAINWLLFFDIPEQKGPVLVVSVIKRTQASAHLMHVRQLLTLAALFTRVLVFHQEKNWLCWKCVINYEVRSAIFWDGNSYHPWRLDR